MALELTLSPCKSASKSPQMKQTLMDTFSELITQGWILPADKEEQENQDNLWYLPYFVANNSTRPIVVYDSAAITGGVSRESFLMFF